MASIYDYFNKQDISGGGGFRYNKGDSTTGPFLTKNTNRPSGQSFYGSMPNYAGYGYGTNTGTGRSSVDAASGFGNPNPSGMGITSINMKPAIDNRSAAIRGTALNPQLSDEEQMQQSGSVPGIVQDAGQMATDLVINPAKNLASGVNNKMNMPGIAGGVMNLLGGMGESISNNQMHHKYLDSVFPNRESKQFALFAEGAKGQELGQAENYFKMAGLSDKMIKDYFDPNNDKGRFMNTNFLRSMSEDKDKFDTGMSFINNAASTGSVYRNMVNASAQDAMDRGVSGVSYNEPDMLNEILPGEPGVDLRPYAGMESGIDYDAMGLGADPENDLLYGEPGFGGPNIVRKDKPPFPGAEDPDAYNPYRDEMYPAPGSIAGNPDYDPVMDILPNEQEYIDINPSFYNVVGRKRSMTPFNFGNNLTSQLMYGDMDSNAPGVNMFGSANDAASFVTEQLNEGNPNSIRSKRFYDRLLPYSI